MPGVLMLESMYQAAAWLVRVTEDFRHSMVMLVEARNVKYSDFVHPGQMLSLTAELTDHNERLSTLKCQGDVNNTVAVRAKLILKRYNLADVSNHDSVTDAYTIKRLREKFQILYAGRKSQTIN
jgi:3-hydroxyacyl-[acyl-carrier-protein] dehydratase